MRIHVVVCLVTVLFAAVNAEDRYCYDTSRYKLCALVNSAKKQHLLNFKVEPASSKRPRIRFATGNLSFRSQREGRCWVPRGPVTDAHEEMFSGVREITKLSWMLLKNIKVCPIRDGISIVDAAKRTHRRLVLKNVRSGAEEKHRLEDASRPLLANRKRKSPAGFGAHITEPQSCGRREDALSSGNPGRLSRAMPSGRFCNADWVRGLTRMMVDLSSHGEIVKATFMFFLNDTLPGTGLKGTYFTRSLPLSSSPLVPGRPGLSLWSVERSLVDSGDLGGNDKILEAVGKEASIPLLDTTNLHILSDENSGSIGAFLGSGDALGTPALWVPLARTACSIVHHYL
ncbi:hypothetical protein FOZ61_002794 [Perkinsus olseni]|nr:hypothetical protein FOZ61_002794 [Perkinsus olseni]